VLDEGADLDRMSDDDGSRRVFDSGVREVTTRAGRVLLHDEERPHAPTADLVDMAYTVAELLEADPYHVESITVADELMLYAFRRGDHVDPTADRRNWSNKMQVAVAAGLICAVLRRPFRDDDEPFIEDIDGIERFRSGLLATIRAPAT
jgi:hypothetical protein